MNLIISVSYTHLDVYKRQEKVQAKMAQEGISREILNSDIFLGEYTVYTNEIKISARDYSAIDGDLVRIWLNGEIVTKVIDLESGYQRYDYVSVSYTHLDVYKRQA